MSGLQRIRHKNKDILLVSYVGIKDKDEYSRKIEHMTESVISEAQRINPHPLNSVLLLVDVTDSIIGNEVVSAFKESAAKAKPYLDKTAVIGAGGIRRILLNAVNSLTGLGGKAFAEIEEAKDWLVK